MEIIKAGISDIPNILLLLKKEFPYVDADSKTMAERMEKSHIFIYKLVEKKEFLGFIDMQLLSFNRARINGLAVAEDARGNNFGKKLLEFGIDFLKKKNVKRIRLLVKEENGRAQKLYKEAGFDFVGLYHENLEGSIIEEMELSLVDEKPQGVI